MVYEVECDNCGKVIAYIEGYHAGYYHEGEYCPECWEEKVDKERKEAKLLGC